MGIFERLLSQRWIAGARLGGMVNLSAGCAALFRGTNQTVRVITNPPGRTVSYNGLNLKDGDLFTVHKQFHVPQLNVGTDRRPLMYDMHYDPDPWLFGDGALCLLFLVPGVIAFGVDFGTGAWRNLEEVQHVYVPATPGVQTPGDPITVTASRNSEPR